ncbi:hypothetical protein [Helicobacter pullorum]|uniref:hypothetical protein n=1 Tax=Helicobacter pullorum TaxID=35818 RepID=UPI00081696B2|nr:hypothetical protein [Helicobacter pullorum]OCR17036.1 hypothetical protein BA916_02585 [Helicobacter pullorum]
MQINTSNYLSLYSNSYNINSKESTQSISQNFNTTENLSQNNKNNVERDTKQIISEILSNKEELPAYISHSYHQNIDNIEKLQNLAQAHLQFIETYNGVIPTELEAKQSIQFLMQEAEEILSVAYNKQPNSEEFRNLLGIFSFAQDSINDFSNNKQKLLNLLKQGQSSLEYATSNEFYHKLFTKANGPNTQTLEEIDRLSKINEEQGFLRDYNVNATLISSYLQDFFTMANDFGFISKDKENKIYQELQTSVIYLGSQGGNIGNSFKIENFTISWEGNSTLFNAYLNGSKISIASQSTPNDFLASNFDTTQSIFDILNQKEKLEKENQDLKNKQAIEAYGINAITNSYTKTQRDNLLKKIIKG